MVRHRGEGVAVRIGFYFRYFWPQAPHLGDMEVAIVNHLAEHGHEIDVFAGTTAHHGGRHQEGRDDRDHVKAAVRRGRTPKERRASIGWRITNEILFQAQFFIWLMKHRSKLDVVVVQSTPPYIPAFLARVAQSVGGPPYVIQVLDIHPEMDLYAQRVQASTTYSLLRRFDSRIGRSSHACVALSSDMARTLRERTAAPPIEVIPNFVAGVDPDPEEASTARGEVLRLIFAGNAGKYQGLETLVDALAINRELPVHVTFVGSGSHRARLEQLAQQAGVANVDFLEHRPLGELSPMLSAADVGVVSLLPGVQRAADPSKIPILLAHGCRLLMIVEDDSDLASFVRDWDVGTVARPGDAQSIADALSIEHARKGRPTDFDGAIEARHSREHALEAWLRLIEAIEQR